MKIEIFVDDEREPRRRLDPPATFELDTSGLEDGPHVLKIRATDEHGVAGVETIPFTVRNGPGIAVVGIAEGETLRGRVSLMVNAFSNRPGEAFEPVRAETPAPVPTWAWVLFLVVAAWGMYYVASESASHQRAIAAVASAPSDASAGGDQAWRTLGEQVFGNNCAACHQANGEGVPGVFPPLKGDPVVTADDPVAHIRTVLEGLSGRVINGVEYASPMPPFGEQLTDEEIAAVISHERTSWGHTGRPIAAHEVTPLRTPPPVP